MIRRSSGVSARSWHVSQCHVTLENGGWYQCAGCRDTNKRGAVPQSSRWGNSHRAGTSHRGGVGAGSQRRLPDRSCGPQNLEPGAGGPRVSHLLAVPPTGQTQLERRGQSKQQPLSPASPRWAARRVRWKRRGGRRAPSSGAHGRGSRLRGDGPHFLPGRGLPLVLNSQGLQTLFLIPQPLAS